ncbi:hypothetical protein [Agreia sp. Leaf283]|uniref:hypothetical protein n=1 Tax=Agreia sp. Leaf283 TaxID=1736321 RepID=UPI0006F7E517|nr:hypothetical protein [Agreia sp. Leaf283]KQP57007.1 hypothetical protein ASF51_03755 [Agreia sp. Leaf283]
MQIVQARIDGQAFVLAVGVDLGELQERILEAARVGAGFVDLDLVGGRRFSVLITPAIPVRFEMFEIDDDGIPDHGQLFSSFDLADQFELFDYADIES